jgi:hypothetical protein
VLLALDIKLFEIIKFDKNKNIAIFLYSRQQKKGIAMTTSEAIFEFEKLKFEIDYFHRKLINEISMIGGFDQSMNSIEARIPEWKARARMIEVNLT